MERHNDSPNYWSRARRRVADWLQENAVPLLASFAGAEAFLRPEDLQAQSQERDIEVFSVWLGQVSAQDFVNHG